MNTTTGEISVTVEIDTPHISKDSQEELLRPLLDEAKEVRQTVMGYVYSDETKEVVESSVTSVGILFFKLGILKYSEQDSAICDYERDINKGMSLVALSLNKLPDTLFESTSLQKLVVNCSSKNARIIDRDEVYLPVQLIEACNRLGLAIFVVVR